MDHYIKDKLNIWLIALVSLSLFFLKWTMSFYIFPNEEIIIRIINESTADSYMYFHYIKSLADFNFKALYSLTAEPNFFLPIPYGSIIFHSIFYKLFGIYSFIFLEFFSIFIFLMIFISIFRLMNFSQLSSLLFATFLFVLPSSLNTLNFFDIGELNTFFENFYNLRFPRPFVANLLFFSFIYVLLNSHLKSDIFEFKSIIFISIIFALSFSSFFFLFFIQLVTLISYILFHFKKNFLIVLKDNLKKIFFSILLFFILALPFLFLIFNSSEDYMQRMGLISITMNDKIFLIKFYLYKIFSLKLIIVYIFVFLSFVLLKKFSPQNHKLIFIFYILFFSSVISPLLFIILSNKIAFLYHFNTMIVISLVLLLIVLFLLNIRLLINSINLNFPKKFYLATSILLILILHNSLLFKGYLVEINNPKRLDRNNVINLLLEENKINIEKVSIQTFDTKLMTWIIFQNNHNLKLIDGTLTLKSNSQIENDLITAFKILNLSKGNFRQFIANKKIGYRYVNHDLKSFFWQKYTANSLYTYNNSTDFEPNVLNFLENSSPFFSHQFALPNFEIKRLLKKFDDTNIDDSYSPDLLILDKNHYIFKEVVINKIKYCKKYDGVEFDFYLLNELCN